MNTYVYIVVFKIFSYVKKIIKSVLQIAHQTRKQLYYIGQSLLIGDAVNLSTNDKTLPHVP